MKEFNKKDKEVNDVQNELKQIYQENHLLSKYLKNKKKTKKKKLIQKSKALLKN